MERKKIIDLVPKILVLAVGVILDTFLIIINSYKLDLGVFLYLLLWLFGPTCTFIGILWLLPIRKIRKMKRYNKVGMGIAILFSLILAIGIPVLRNCYPYSLARIGCYLGYGMILSGGIGLDLTLIIWFNKVRSISIKGFNKVANLIVLLFLLILLVGLSFQFSNDVSSTGGPSYELVIRVNYVLGLYLLIIGAVGVGITLPIWLVLLAKEKKTRIEE